MTILNLIIHNSNIEIYRQMYEVLSPFYKKFSFVETFFIEYDETLDCEYEINGDILKLKGVESMIPGLLHKTLDSLLILREIGKKYTWIVRSNDSTVVNFSALSEFLNKNPEADYFSGLVNNLQWVDVASGTSDERYFGTIFGSGTMFGFSNELTNHILKKRHKLKFDLIDDLSFGVFVVENFPGVICQQINNTLVSLINGILTIEEITKYENESNPVAWRNRQNDRNIDLMNMRIIIDVLNEKIGKMNAQMIDIK